MSLIAAAIPPMVIPPRKPAIRLRKKVIQVVRGGPTYWSPISQSRMGLMTKMDNTADIAAATRKERAINSPASQ